jgi:hypothetical protein
LQLSKESTAPRVNSAKMMPKETRRLRKDSSKESPRSPSLSKSRALREQNSPGSPLARPKDSASSPSSSKPKVFASPPAKLQSTTYLLDSMKLSRSRVGTNAEASVPSVRPSPWMGLSQFKDVMT